jgi:nuclear pore complex protein Nup188
MVSTYSLDLLKILASFVASRFFYKVSNLLTAASANPSTIPFWGSPNAMNDINLAMLDLAQGSNQLASIPIYAWVIFIHQSTGSIRLQSMADSAATYTTSANLQSLASAAVNTLQLPDMISRVGSSLPRLYGNSAEAALENDMRESLLSMLSYSIDNGLLEYEQEVVGSLLSLLDADRSYWAPLGHRTLDTVSPKMIATNLLGPWIESALSRFPLEAAPLIRFMKAFLLVGSSASSAYIQFSSIFDTQIKGFTEQLNPDFSAYDEADIDPSNGYFIQLLGELPLFISRFQAAHAHGASNGGALVLASQTSWEPLSVMDIGTQGEVLGNQERPLIVDWAWSFNPLDYLIDWLATAAPGSQQVLFSSLAPPSQDDCCDIISLCTTMLSTLKDSNDLNFNAEEMAKALLDTTPRGFEDGKDIISIVFEIFEYQLQQHREQSSGDASSDLLTRCVEFIHATSFFRPARVWPLLARSQLLDLNGSDPSLVAIVTNSEMVKGDYAFLQSCIKLFERLVDLAVAQDAMKSPSQVSTVKLTRFATEANGARTRYIPAKTVKNIIIGYLRIMISVFENSQFWQFASGSQRVSVNVSLMQSFEKILKATYGFLQPEDLRSKDGNVLADCAIKLTDLCLTSGPADGLVTPIISILSSPLLEVGGMLDPIDDELYLEKSTVLNLCSTILRVAIYTLHEESLLERRLFKAAPLLAKLYATASPLHSPVAQLMDVLLTAALRHDRPPPSLLGHMGAATAKSFLSLLTRLSKPCATEEQQLSTWKLLSTVVSSQQQWFALYLLTGKAPRDIISNDDPHSTGCSGQAVFKYALDQLSTKFSVVPSAKEQGLRVALAMLEFVSQSYNHWPWAVTTLKQHPKFILSLTEYFARLGRFDIVAGTMTWHTSIGAAIAEILTMHLHTARQSGDVKPALSLVNKLGYVKNYAFKPPQYNWSLQNLLKRNVSSVTGTLDISKFQHTLAFPAEYGSNFFYDVPMAMALINAAKQPSGRQSLPQSFAKDFEHTNMDISKVDAQMQLHKKCKLLVIELAHALPKDPKLDLMDPLLDILSDVLKYMDMKTTLSSAIYDNLSRSQVDLALILLQRLVSLKNTSKLKDLVDQFPAIWQSVSSIISNFDLVYTSKTADVNRKVLRILFLGIQPLTKWRGKEPDLAASARATVVNRLAATTYTQLLEIVTEVVAKGFKSLAGLIHENSASSSPSDFALLTAMLQTILAVPGIETIHSPMVLQFQNTEVSRYASSLFSWSDQLLVDGDPVYGEHSILFLLELSSIPSMAEGLAVDGILSQLSSANLMALYSRPQGAGPFDNPPRAHSIWARGILPLCLNLLSAVGAPIAAEVVSFLSQSSPQLARLAHELNNTNSSMGTRPSDTHMTLTTAAETHTLSLLSAAIDHVRASGGAAEIPPELPRDVWDPKAIREDVEEWLSARSVRRDWIVPVTERDAELASLKPVDPASRCESRLEERVWAELQGAKDCLRGGGVGLE